MMITSDLKVKDIEIHREFWAQLARENNWYVEPFYVHVWINDSNEIVDSVSYKGLWQDVIDEY